MQKSSDEIFLESAGKMFRYYKKLADGAIAQIGDADIHSRPNDSSNSIALIVHHLSGNMTSRFTDFLTADGEKPWRNREAEFEEGYPDKQTMLAAWEQGWNCLFNVLDSLTPADLLEVVYIRNEGQTVLEALQRQMFHYAMHVGQIVYQAKALKGSEFKSLSIAKGASKDYNQNKFSKEKEIRHFTDQV